MNVALVIMVKHPVPGQVKTRLCPPLTLDQAAELYRRFLLDKMAQVRRIAAAAPYLAFTPREAEAYFRNLAGETFSLVPQEGRDLGERLRHLSTRLLTAGHPGVVIIDSDTPSLPDHCLAEGVARIGDDRIDAVFGPAEDGGYYLVALRRPAPALFQGIAWSTGAVLAQTLDRAAKAGLHVHLLPSWFDVDTGCDLERLAGDLGTNGPTARHTWAFLQTCLARHPGGNPGDG
jgi:rSAM/selenodomain-associated transferase 1